MTDHRSSDFSAPLAALLGPPRRGKVRDVFALGDKQIMVTTDRQSAFDRVLGDIPFKGQVLTRLAAWWFERTADLVPNHFLAMPDPNVLLVRRADVWPVEMVIRGYITGVTTTSLWYGYSRGERVLYGQTFPDGLRKNERLPRPVITPTTKAESGQHDEKLTAEQILAQGLVPASVYRGMEAATRALFERGQAMAAARGILLVDTKYEFGDVDGQLTLIDEIHTPDSSRFWSAESYGERFAAGLEPEAFDKEFLRLWFVDHGYRGEGEPPPMPSDLAWRMSRLYIEVFERLTGERFVPDEEAPGERIVRNLRAAGLTGGRPL